MNPYPLVSSPVVINQLTIANRVVRTAHEVGFSAGEVTEQLIVFHEQRARGGVGLSILEASGVHPSSPSGISSYLDSTMEGWSELASRCHPHGMKVFQLLYHAGMHRPPADGGASWSASEVADPFMGRLAIAMSPGMIDEIVESFAAAARRCKTAGLDGVEIQCGHGYLIAQFLSPLTNRRTDEYGGTLSNRLRFAEGVLRAVRDAVGPDFPVGMRISADEVVEGGLAPEETTSAVRYIERSGLIDWVNVSRGNYHAVPEIMASMRVGAGYQLQSSEALTRDRRLPMIIAGRYTTLQEAEQALASGVADMVAMVRATIADPDLVRKTLSGRAAEVRPCIGCNQGCVAARLTGAPLSCTVNPAVGHELDNLRLDPAPMRRRVMVVGAGPAGMEAARTAALRGHEVVVHEATTEVGGLVRWARMAPLRDDLGRICDWQKRELRRLGVEVRCSSPVDIATIEATRPDAVVVATGSTMRRDGFQRYRPGLRVAGADLPHVVTAVDVLSGKARPAEEVLVYDDFGNHIAVGVVELLLRRGALVALATSQIGFAPQLLGSLDRDPAARRLSAYSGYSFISRVLLERITTSEAVLRDLDTDAVTIVNADLVVLVTGFLRDRSLYNSLLAESIDARLVGDAIVPSDLQHAISTGHATAMVI